MHPDATEQTFKSITTMAKNLSSQTEDAYSEGINGVNTSELVASIKRTADGNDGHDRDDGDDGDDGEEDGDGGDGPDAEEDRAQDYKNRCQTEGEFADQNKLAFRRGKRNLNELKFACNRHNLANDEKYDFDPMVLRYDQSWQMPYKKPPMCTMTSKQKCDINPVQTQTALIGTLLDDAKDTKVGSIMPDFKFAERKTQKNAKNGNTGNVLNAKSRKI
jgi:hypothetical protein